MKKIFCSIVLCTFIAAAFALNKGIEDTSNVRISDPELRAQLLIDGPNGLRKKLRLNDETAEKLREVTLILEEKLQVLVEENPAPLFVTAAKKKGNDIFDDLSIEREKIYKSILDNATYSSFSKMKWGIRNDLTKDIKAYAEERGRERKREQAMLDSIAAAEKARAARAAAAAAKKGGKSSAKSGAPAKKAPAKKAAPKKKK
ncbi:hypothetical protein FACS1894156_5300 [Bacteroidia bacterium]|nr:hypothetical protein FACS1894156_5300 [Bacteroidia bacterium]